MTSVTQDLLNVGDVALTVLRWCLGLILGMLLGVAGALCEHWLRLLRRPLLWAADFLRALPVIALVPVVQMTSGAKEYGKIGLIAWAVLFPVWISVRQALQSRYQEAELAFRAARISPSQVWLAYTLPRGLHGVFRGVDISIGIAWIASVAAEWVGTYTQGFWAGGIGYRLLVAYNTNSWSGIGLCLFAFGFLGLVASRLWRLALAAVPRLVKGFDPTRA